MTAVTRARQLRGWRRSPATLLRPADEGYDEARRGFNGLIDKRPALIARCLGEADIADAIAFARDAGLEISSGAAATTSPGGLVTDGGLMIDLSPMKRHLRRPRRPLPRASSRGSTGGS